MAKRNKQIKLFISLGACALGLAAFCMMFADALKTGSLLTVTYKGYQAAFGYAETLGNTKLQILDFNIFITLGFVLPLAAGVVEMIFPKSKLFTLVCGAAFIVGGVFIFLMPVFMEMSMSSDIVPEFSLLTAPIIGGVLALLGGLVTWAKLAIK